MTLVLTDPSILLYTTVQSNFLHNVAKVPSREYGSLDFVFTNKILYKAYKEKRKIYSTNGRKKIIFSVLNLKQQVKLI